MGAVYQSTTENFASLATSIAINKPTSTATDDILIAHLECNASTTWTPPTGWNTINTTAQSATYWRRVGSAPGSDGATYSFSSSAIFSNIAGTITRLTNAHLTAPIDGSNLTIASSANVSSAAVTPSFNDGLLLAVFAYTVSTGAVTVPSGMTQRHNSTGGVTKAIASLAVNSGSTGSKTWTNAAAQVSHGLICIRTGATAYSQTPSDTATATDAAAKAADIPQVDSVATADAHVLQPNKAADDSVGTSDAIAGKALGKGAGDAPNAYDASAAAVGKPLTDGASLTDDSFRAIGPNPADSLTASDEKTFTTLKGIAETATASEDITLILGLLRSIGEVSEAVDQIAQALTMGTQTAEVVATEAFSAGVALGIDESVSTADAASRIVAFLRSVNDLVGVADAPAKHLTLSFSDTIGVASDWPASNPTRQIAGVALNHETGEPVEGATLRLFRTLDDAIVQTTTSAADGSYSFARDADDPYTYYVTADLSAGTPVHGVTDRGLVPELI